MCGSLNILNGADASPYYAEDYFSFAPRGPMRANRGLRMGGEALARASRGHLGMLLGRRTTRILPSWVHWFGGYGIEKSSLIVDVGSGSGALLQHLARFGFSRLVGIDPYLTKLDPPPGIRLVRAQLGECSSVELADAVIFNHSLEHLDDPSGAIASAAAILHRRGPIVVILPIAGGAAWRRYRDMWIALDAPLHRFIPTTNGLHALARRAGLSVRRMSGRTTAWNYLASEAVRRGGDPTAPWDSLSDLERGWFERLARSERGGEAAEGTFVLERSSES